MTFYEWAEKYKLLGELENFDLKTVNPECIWSEVEDDNGTDSVMMPGNYFVNAIAQYVTELPADVDYVDLERGY